MFEYMSALVIYMKIFNHFQIHTSTSLIRKQTNTIINNIKNKLILNNAVYKNKLNILFFQFWYIFGVST